MFIKKDIYISIVSLSVFCVSYMYETNLLLDINMVKEIIRSYLVNF